MFQGSEIFEKHYQDYCSQLAKTDFGSVQAILKIRQVDSQLAVPFFNGEYTVSGEGIFNASGKRPDYGVCVIIAKYILHCPKHSHHDPEWVSFKDFKRTSHFTNVNYFASDTEQAIAGSFSGKLDLLSRAGKELGGNHHEMNTSYDLSMRFNALPCISLLLLFNDGDDEFPVQCSVLFEKHAEFYLDPESLAMSGAFLAKSLKRCALI